MFSHEPFLTRAHEIANMSAKKVLSKEMTLSGVGKKEFNRKLKRYKVKQTAYVQVSS